MSVARVRDRVLERHIEEEMQHAFLDYSMSVIVRRALPDVRDGLKPVHRRILVAMHGLGLRPDRDYKKSASVVGEVLGKYHPHGDAAVYDALVRMVQEFSLRYPLVDGQGNFGSIDGDSAAAYRYTEVRLASVATELLAEIEKGTVDWENNFDDRLKEPAVLPSTVPNLLANGCSGIAVGMSTNVPPHNLREVADALRTLVANPGCDTAELMEQLPGPDFPTGGYIVGRAGIRRMYENGRGRMTMRARVVTEAVRGGRKQLVVTELPYAVSKSRIIAQIAGLSRKGKLPDVADLRDESDREGIRLVVELKRGADVGNIMALLFKKTALQSTFGAILLALDGGKQPEEFTLKELLERFRDHRLDVIRRRSRFDLDKAEADLHVTRGLLTALARIDEVIAVIRRSTDRAQAAARLQERFDLSDTQADAILRMRLAGLTTLEGDQLRVREAGLLATIRKLRGLLANESLQLTVMLKELDEVVERYGDARRTVILEGKDKTDFAYVKSSVADEDVVVTISQQGYLKRIPMHLYRRRTAAGLAMAAMERYRGDYLETVVVARTRGWLLAFTSKGKVYFLRVEEVPEGSRAARGKSIWALLGIDRRDPIIAVRPVDDLTDDRYLAFVTRAGLAKRTRLHEYSNPMPAGIIAIRLRQDDTVLDVHDTSGDTEFLLVTRQGRALRFPEREVPVRGRVALGVKGISLRGEDEVVAFIAARREAPVLLVTERGAAKRTPLADFPIRKRSGLGVAAMATRDCADGIVGALEGLDDDRVVLLSAGGVPTAANGSSVALKRRTAPAQSIVSPGAGDRIMEVTRLNGDEPAHETQFDLMGPG